MLDLSRSSDKKPSSAGNHMPKTGTVNTNKLSGMNKLFPFNDTEGRISVIKTAHKFYI